MLVCRYILSDTLLFPRVLSFYNRMPFLVCCFLPSETYVGDSNFQFFAELSGPPHAWDAVLNRPQSYILGQKSINKNGVHNSDPKT